jgi:hypothetical protein
MQRSATLTLFLSLLQNQCNIIAAAAAVMGRLLSVQVFCFFVSQDGNAFAYASPNFQEALQQLHLDALKQVSTFVFPSFICVMILAIAPTTN